MDMTVEADARDCADLVHGQLVSLVTGVGVCPPQTQQCQQQIDFFARLQCHRATVNGQPAVVPLWDGASVGVEGFEVYGAFFPVETPAPAIAKRIDGERVPLVGRDLHWQPLDFRVTFGGSVSLGLLVHHDQSGWLSVFPMVSAVLWVVCFSDQQINDMAFETRHLPAIPEVAVGESGYDQLHAVDREICLLPDWRRCGLEVCIELALWYAYLHATALRVHQDVPWLVLDERLLVADACEFVDEKLSAHVVHEKPRPCPYRTLGPGGLSKKCCLRAAPIAWVGKSRNCIR